MLGLLVFRNGRRKEELMVPVNPCESYAMLVRESMQFDIPTPSRRIEIIRELPQPAVFNAVHIITGIRRCGKTFYLFQKIHDLLQNGSLA